MRRLLTCIFSALLLCSVAGPAGAVEKKTSSKKQSTTVEAKKKPAPKQQPTKKRSYDSFVDKYRNGIDDRRERYRSVKKLVTPKKTVDKKAAEKKTESKKD